MNTTGADAPQIVQIESSAARRPEHPIAADHAEGPGKLDALIEPWPDFAGLLTLDFARSFVAAFIYLTGVTLVALGMALILR